MDVIKVLLSFVIGSFVAILDPMREPIAILVMLFVFDILCGIISDHILHGSGFSFTKFLRSILFLCLYVITIAVIYAVCYLQKDIEEGLMLLKTITYVCSYFYFSNIAKNLHETYPKNRFFSFLFFVLSVDVITGKIPALKKFLSEERRDANLPPQDDESTNPLNSQNNEKECIL